MRLQDLSTQLLWRTRGAKAVLFPWEAELNPGGKHSELLLTHNGSGWKWFSSWPFNAPALAPSPRETSPSAPKGWEEPVKWQL